MSVFNSYHDRLKFTHELEKDNTLNFLNIGFIRNYHNKFFSDKKYDVTKLMKAHIFLV